jgi:ATP-dependent helicase/nuclease subunit A
VRRIIAGPPPEHEGLRDRFDALSEHFERVERGGDLTHSLHGLLDHARVKGVHQKHWPTEQDYVEFREAAKELREELQKLDFDMDDARPAAEAGLQLLEVMQPIAAAYAARKRELACLDFDDLLTYAHTLLTRPGHERLRRQVAGRIRLLLFDEFQDTDPLQVELVKALCDGDVAGGKLFFVGDFKQSIYRFRRADPQVFRALSQEIPKAGRLPLTKNFRSQPAILDFVNVLFGEEMGEGYEPLVPHRPQVSPTPAIEFLWAVTPEDGGDRHILLPGHRKISQPPSPRPRKSGSARPIGWPAACGFCTTAASRWCGTRRQAQRAVPPRGRWSSAIWPCCSAPCRTCSGMKRRCASTIFRITSSADMPSMPSRKCSIC